MNTQTRVFRLACAAIAAFALATPNASAADRDAAIRQPTVVVTALRRPQNADTALAAITVITRADLERSQAPDLISVLGQQAGIDVSRTGGPGQASTIFLRGANSNQTLILIDGVRVAATGSGLFDLAHLPPEQVERIEIVRGPRAALWGSDAIGGVIHIFTRKPDGPSARLTAGRYGRGEISSSMGWQGNDSGLAVTAGYRHFDGLSASNTDAFSFDPDADGLNNRNVSVRGHSGIGNQKLALTALVTNADVAFDQGASSVRNISSGLSLSGMLAGVWSHRLSLGIANEDLDTPAFGSVFDSRRQTADWVLTRDLAATGTLSVGVSSEHEQGRSLDFGALAFDRSRNTQAGFAAYGGTFGAHAFEAALRYDDNSQFGHESTASAAWAWQFAPRWRTRLSWGQGFRAPNFNELYSPGFGGLFAGNPALNPERSRTVEGAIDFTPDREQRLSLSVYRTRVGDLVAFDGVDFSAINIKQARLDGAELEYHAAYRAWQIDLNAGWQRAQDRSANSDLLRRAPRKLALQVSHVAGNGWLLGLDGTAVSSRADFGGDLGGYSRFDVRTAYPINAHWQIEARLENLLARDYALARGFNTPGRSLSASLVWNPQRRKNAF
ncbi:MAG: hypothetical protein COW59_03030 [Lysobacterales bacterium CG17_big_fil_post_rev_8_21_14_2_50_64_11]|nr:MAG: hypothetical protein COW59_03030 [Xanthomonadales bacterium CG17_big_fil_post_rev_8_21_14_2_50_64_11]PIX60283.1 MAG: hypothetical protein COZ47_08045 [Xanthomonadales bacterium CG_4_10_14_3_um_filter_64_11]